MDKRKIEDQIPTGEIDAWQRFVHEKLLRDDVIDGILLLTFHGSHVYSYGQLSNLHEESFHQFTGIFDLTTEEENKFFQNGFKLFFKTEGEVLHQKFVIRKKTFHSVYAVSKLNRFGLIVINLPFGILIASHRHPITSAIASDFVENAAEVLRM